TFADQVTYPTGTSPSSVAAVDLNGDGVPDLAVANGGNTAVSVLLNKGDGTFAPQTTYPTGLGPSSITAADLNRHRIPHLAAPNTGDNTVSVLLNDCSP